MAEKGDIMAIKEDEAHNKMQRIIDEMDAMERRLHALEIKRDELYNKREQLTEEYQKAYEAAQNAKKG